jgi:hypothetical protein
MIDALLYAVRDGIRAAGMNYGIAECEIVDDGRPPPRAGNVFVAIHGGKTRPGSANDNNLYEMYDFLVTLTMRVTIPMDRVGDQLIARNLPLTINNVPAAQRQGFNAKIEQLRAYLHMNWQITVLQNHTPNSANDNLAAWATTTAPNGIVYGFVEPMRYRGSEVPSLQGGEWMGVEPEYERYSGKKNEREGEFCVKSEMRFADAKRFQPVTSAQGSLV